MPRSQFEILSYDETSLGPLCLRRRELLSDPGTIVTEVTLNHEFLMSSYNTDSERVISNRSVQIHGGRDLKTLVGGLGLGYTARELINEPKVASVEVVEFLKPVISWLHEGLMPIADELNSSEKLRISQGDVYSRLLGSVCSAEQHFDAPETYDLIVIDVDHSPSDQLGSDDNPFYTAVGLNRAKLHLNDRGVLAVWSYAESSHFVDSLHETFAKVYVEPVTTMNALVDQEQTDWLFFGVK